MNDKQRAQLTTYAEAGARIESSVEARRWITRVTSFLTEAIGPDETDRFRNLFSSNIFDELAMKLGHVEGLLAEGEDQSVPEAPRALDRDCAGTEPILSSNRDIFVVHGHDGEAKESVARFLEKLKLNAIILHEKPNQGRTLIEKFETSSKDVAFAVVLLTPDDLGCAADKPENLDPRARQNVILELGYFMGRLGRTRVCALYKGGVELPSDFQGVVYIELDTAGAWRTKLAQELLGAKITIKLEGLLN